MWTFTRGYWTVCSTWNDEKKPSYHIHISHMLHVWYIYLHDWVISNANVRKYMQIFYTLSIWVSYHPANLKKVGAFFGLTKNRTTTKIIYKDNYVPAKGRMQRLFNQQKKRHQQRTQHRELFRNSSASPTEKHVVLNVLHVFQGMTSAQRRAGSSIPWKFHDLMTNRPTPQTGTSGVTKTQPYIINRHRKRVRP